MTFVEFELTGGGRVYINAERIDALVERGEFTEVFVGGADAPLTVAGGADAVVEQLRSARGSTDGPRGESRALDGARTLV